MWKWLGWLGAGVGAGERMTGGAGGGKIGLDDGACKFGCRLGADGNRSTFAADGRWLVIVGVGLTESFERSSAACDDASAGNSDEVAAAGDVIFALPGSRGSSSNFPEVGLLAAAETLAGIGLFAAVTAAARGGCADAGSSADEEPNSVRGSVSNLSSATS